MTQDLTPELVKDWLKSVVDPEIPTVSLVDLGVIYDVAIENGNQVKVKMTPTFAGCPAIQLMRMEAEACLKNHGIEHAEVEITHNKPWSSDNLTEAGKEGLKQHGLALPPPSKVLDQDEIPPAVCPQCGSSNTQMMSPFGPTACRALHHCYDCHESFEQFKPL
jgi:phenylacetate-CoA oxygenase, PaaJ subunit